MNIASNLLSNFVFCSAGFIPLPDTHGYVEYEDDKEHTSYAEQLGLKKSQQEPESDWHIDFSLFGYCYAAIPPFSSPLSPTRIDVHIPQQTKWPPELWSVLGARDSVHMSGPRVNELGISHHLRRALGHWSRGTEGFEKIYRGLPFGSRIVVRNIEPDVANMDISIRPNDFFGKSLLSVLTLESLWPASGRLPMPPCVRLDQLRYEKQLSLQVALVSLHTEAGREFWVFKSQASGSASLYHELKVLLHQPPCAHVIEAPAYLVTVNCLEQNEDRVCGFLLKYYSHGTMAKLLPRRRRDGSLTLSKQVQWAKEITAALVHIAKTPAKFYSDLRMDNIVIDVKEDASETAVILDLEQGRNIYNWAPPEVYYLEWIAELGSPNHMRTDNLPQETVAHYSEILKRYLALKGHGWPLPGTPDVYDNPTHGWYYPWTLSTQEEREAGMVFLLAKALWCIFEGREEADVILGRSTLEDGQLRFPEFHLTPGPIRKLIKECSARAREWKDGNMTIYRRGGRLFPLGKTGLNGEAEGTLEETIAATRLFWQDEMVKAEAFLEARMRYYQGEGMEEDLQLLGYLRRPSLSDVLHTLESFSSENKM